jgi:hypothetical protein
MKPRADATSSKLLLDEILALDDGPSRRAMC